MNPFILIADGLDTNVFEQLTIASEFDVHPKSKVTQDELKTLLPKVEGLVIRSATKVNQELIDAAPNLKYVIRAGEGTDNIDKAACQNRDIRVSNTPGANNNSAAEHAVALMMTLARKTAFANNTMSAGGWDKSKYTGLELANKTIGIVGFGRIGQIVAKRLAGFEPKVLFYDPFLDSSDIPYVTKAKDLQEVFSKSDIITVHTPLMDATRNLIGKDLLELMPSHALFVNAARGGIVNEEDFLSHMQNNKIRAAALDVFATEPLPEESPLRKLDNVVLTPHLGASTEEAQQRVGAMALHQLKEFFGNNNLLNEVRA